MTILVKKVFISSKPTFVYLLCPPLCGPFSIQESAAGGLSYKVKKDRKSYDLQSMMIFWLFSHPLVLWGSLPLFDHFSLKKVTIYWFS